jgi:N-acetylglucosamine kinase-like BadF-type ATPase
VNLVLGVDGGGSKTHAVVADDEGTLLGFATNGPSNWETVGLRGAADSLRDASAKALAPTGRSARDLKAAAFGLAGVDWPSDVPRVEGVIAQLELGCDHSLVNDSIVALRAGTRDAHGVVLVAGTGAVAAGVNRRGETFRTLGQGVMLGDVGSASDVSDAAVRAVADAYLGRGPETSLTELLCTLAGCRSAAEFLEQYSRGIEPPRTAAPTVLRAAEAGDAVALEIVRWAGTALGETAVVIARRLDMLDDEFDTVLSGGLFRGASQQLELAVLEALAPHAPGARLVRLDPPPVVGAVIMALEQFGIELELEQRRVLEAQVTAAVRRPPGAAIL